MQVADCSGTADASLCSAGRTKCVRPYTTAQTLRKTYIEAGCRLFRRCTRRFAPRGGRMLRPYTTAQTLRKTYIEAGCRLFRRCTRGALLRGADECVRPYTTAQTLRKTYIEAGCRLFRRCTRVPSSRGGRMRPPLHNPMLLLYGMGPQGFFEPWIELL